ncbi:MAG: hypothetical protein IJ447_01640 [Clostridia bacterium]|nr:hypothetical protein [Clostridia bacterium]
MPNVSVILPTVSDKSKFARFCTSLFSSSLDIELLVCCDADSEFLTQVSEEYAEKIKIFTIADKLSALTKAIEAAQGKFLILSDVSVTFADNAFEKLIVASAGNSSACNVGEVKTGTCKKAFSQGFVFDELSAKPYYFNHLLSVDVIKNNSLAPCGADELSIMLFIADYYRYETCNTVDEVWLYTDTEFEYKFSAASAFMPEYASVFKATQNERATLFFLRAVFTALLNNLQNESFNVLKSVASLFSEDYELISWAKSTFGVDILMLCDQNTRFEDFKYNGTNVFYKEVTLPVTPESVIKNFYFGKFGIDVLKKCIGAWGYYKFYRMKDGTVKKYGCKLFSKLLGGDFDA